MGSEEKFIKKLNFDSKKFEGYVEEFKKVVEEKCIRSATNLGWGLFMCHLYTLIDKKIGIEKFSTEIKFKNKSAKTISDMSNFKDEEIIGGLYSQAIFIDNNIRKMFNTLKDKRNMSAHINLVKYDENKLNSFFEEVIELIDYIDKHLKDQKLSFDSEQFNALKDEKDIQGYVEELTEEERMKLFQFLFVVLENTSEIFEEKGVLEKKIMEEYDDNFKYFKTIEIIYESFSEGEKRKEFLDKFIYKFNLFEDKAYLDFLIKTLKSLKMMRQNLSRASKKFLVNFLIRKFSKANDFHYQGECMRDIRFYFDLFDKKDLSSFLSGISQNLKASYYSWSALATFKDILENNQEKFENANVYKWAEELSKREDQE